MTMARHAFLDHPGPIAFAHRGGAGPWPENSWPAFTHAIALGYRYLETDIRVTRDGTAMILHDPTLDRVSDHVGPLSELTAAEAARIRLHPPADTPTVRVQDRANSSGGEPIPRLDDLLDRWPDARFNLDVKEAAALEPTIAALRRVKALDRVCVTSFDDGVAGEARRLAGPDLCLGAGMSAIAAARIWSVLPSRLATRRPRGLVGRDVVQVPVSYRSVRVCDARFIRYMSAVGLPVHVWTVNDEAAMDALLDLGVDGLITDRPESLRTVLRRRDLWPAP
ncbi:glycerophosphodiester phosphodiesterase family protein [Pseudofrankia inefficax]|uniref:Glycerophosphoryl diester phosphodiesterase n=1 Tax=Pseudofrankia inefficax (strain DSM 45817 / CECT 9037 / DDB 130130 / EuI1c) TaxID=298654 RepID=E3IVQ1_PSEI1|nr:glycerophosphodiester phosphodiesterase family protein [Pseudofrankia inefficax]ADP83703.1 glycerophosphoryl diester phosphodiesterase [Pseudofrankia inefficax]